MQLAVDDRAYEKPMTFDADPAELEMGAGAADQLLRAVPVTGRGKVWVRLRASSPAGRRGGELLGDPFGRAIGVGDHVGAHGLEATGIKLDELEEGDQVKILYEPNRDGHNDVMEIMKAK